MTARSTRNKIRYQAKMCVDKLERIQQHLKSIDEMSEGSSEAITEQLPALIMAVDLVMDFHIAFRDSL